MKISSASTDHTKKIQFFRYEVVTLDQDIKAKIEAVEAFSGRAPVLNQLCFTIRQKLNECEEKIGDLEEINKSLKQCDEKEDLAVLIKRYRSELAKNLRNFRHASQVALRNIEVEERASLFISSGIDLRVRSSNLTQQSAALSDNLTNLLKAMDSQVRQSEETLKTLVESSHVLGEAESELRSMGSTIVSSGKLLSKYGRREMTDKILFALALIFFFGTVLYIVKKRMFAGY